MLVTSRAKGGKKKMAKLWRALEETGASLHSYTDPVVKYHPKYLVADEGPAIVASLNFTRKCFKQHVRRAGRHPRPGGRCGPAPAVDRGPRSAGRCPTISPSA